MFWKLVVMVVTIGGTGCGLLVLRQQEIDLLSAETDLLRRGEKVEQSLQMTRWELEQLTQDARFEKWFEEQGFQLEPVDRTRSGENDLAGDGPSGDGDFPQARDTDTVALGGEERGNRW